MSDISFLDPVELSSHGSVTFGPWLPRLTSATLSRAFVMRPATEQGPRTTLTDEPQRVVGQPNFSSGDDKNISLLNDNQTATIFVVRGVSKGLEHQLTKAKTTIGRAGGGADIEIDDVQVSVLTALLRGPTATIRFASTIWLPRTGPMSRVSESRPPVSAIFPNFASARQYF